MFNPSNFLGSLQMMLAFLAICYGLKSQISLLRDVKFWAKTMSAHWQEEPLIVTLTISVRQELFQRTAIILVELWDVDQDSFLIASVI